MLHPIGLSLKIIKPKLSKSTIFCQKLELLTRIQCSIFGLKIHIRRLGSERGAGVCHFLSDNDCCDNPSRFSRNDGKLRLCQPQYKRSFWEMRESSSLLHDSRLWQVFQDFSHSLLVLTICLILLSRNRNFQMFIFGLSFVMESSFLNLTVKQGCIHFKKVGKRCMQLPHVVQIYMNTYLGKSFC